MHLDSILVNSLCLKGLCSACTSLSIFVPHTNQFYCHVARGGVLKPFMFDQPDSFLRKLGLLCRPAHSVSHYGDPTLQPTKLERDSTNLFRDLHRQRPPVKSFITTIQVSGDSYKRDFSWRFIQNTSL